MTDENNIRKDEKQKRSKFKGRNIIKIIYTKIASRARNFCIFIKF